MYMKHLELEYDLLTSSKVSNSRL